MQTVKNSGMRILIHVLIEQTRLWDAVASYVHGIRLLTIRGCLSYWRYRNYFVFQSSFKTILVSETCENRENAIDKISITIYY